MTIHAGTDDQNWRRAPLVRPIAFAHRGARANAPENTIEAFVLARRLGATGIESDVWVTADGHAVLDHDGVVRSGIVRGGLGRGAVVRRKPIRETQRKALPSHIPGLDELYNTCGTGFDLSLDLKDDDALDAVLATVKGAGSDAGERCWLCHPRWEQLALWRPRCTEVRLVDSTRLRNLKEGPERHAARLGNAGIDAINMHYSDWNLGLTTLFHRFDRFVFGWDAQQERMLRDLVRMEIDGLYCDDVERMMGVVAPSP